MKKSGLICSVVAASLFSVSSMALAQQEDAPAQPTAEQIAQEVQGNTRFIAQNALSKAKSLLEYYGDFAPFGLALFPNGDIKYVWAVRPGEEVENLNAPLVLNTVRTALGTQAQAGRILGSAVVYKYQATGDAEEPQINIELEYLGGFSQVLATRYTETDEGYQYSEGVFGSFNPIVFAENNAGVEAN
ncbi:hypothetical protein [Marinobacter zhejiangensis]|uniref:Uncharacterized protein n=1 Tax=Marinobacter zhejiangensis TaxID=488535 RepID=A0A1I4RS66_9GAMM|nr:hypothetical protein [Marinobacter zhejiangensis]SFM55026.1 hypothetical protein SAMN04487963_2916 [Marinobacter zhejiangensis]